MELNGSRAVFDSVASYYDNTLPIHIQNYYCRKRFSVLKNYLCPGWICSVAGGTGTLETLLQRTTTPALLVDISFKMCKVAKSRNVSAVVCADAAALPIKSRCMVLCYSIAAFHHIVDKVAVGKAISEMFRITARGGSLMIWDHNPLNPYWKIIMAKMPQDRGPTRIVPFEEFMTHLRKLRVSGTLRHWRSGWVPEFAPAKLLFLFSGLEWILERTPFIRNYAAHNVFILTCTDKANNA